MRRIDRIILHCSASDYGNALLIDQWHRARGWRGIGYHYVIQNSYPDHDSLRLKRPQFSQDGVPETGRPIEQTGAHTRGYNATSIGICLIGRGSFTQQQFASLAELIIDLKGKFPEAGIFGHYELIKPGLPLKTCPNIDMDWLRALLL